MSSQYSADALKRSATIRRRATPDAAAPARPAAAAHPLLRLQQQIGNSQVARMLAQRDHLPEEEEPVQASHDPALLQRQPDQEEEELQAQHDAGLAQRQAEEEEELQAQHDPSLMRQAEEEEEPLQARHEPGMAMRQPDQEEEEPVQAKNEGALSQRQPDQEEEEIQTKPEVGLEGGPLSDDLASRIQAKRGSGAPLDTSTRTAMESAFGTSFEDVRVHADAESDQLNRRISAKAFTTGSDIFFRQGGYDPSSSTGRELLSHELSHVVQQRAMDVGSPMTVNPAGDRYEQEADAVASQVSRLVESGEAQRELDEASLQRQSMAPEEEERRG